MTQKFKIKNEDLRSYVENEGLGYFILHYCSEDNIEDPEIAALFKKARLALQEFQAKVDSLD